MRKVRWIFGIMVFMVALFFALNFSWTHAAVAWLVTKSECPAKLIVLAKKDVAALFGSTRSSPLWVCTTKPLLGLDISHGTTRSALFLPSIIVIGKKGPKRNVMAHEYVHAELAARLGARYALIPTWFDEGLAMQVDYRRLYTPRALARYLRRKEVQKPYLDDLASSFRFYRRGKGRINYAFANCVVKNWLKAQGAKQPLKLITNIEWKKSFPIEQFRKAEQRCLLR
ncbi:MAG: hypothetical protein GY927_24800 [bacterium]|nr:hypothetical protein [bacterium]